MPENQPRPEAQVMLPQAVNDVVKLYLDYQSGAGARSIKERDNSWKQTAKQNPAFSEKITELGEALKEANKKKKEHSDIAITKYPELFFKNVPDEQVKEFLVNIWCSRITVPDNPNLLMGIGYAVADDMRREMTKKDNNGNFCTIQPKVSLAEVMGSVLQGKLKLTHQPKQRV